MHPRLPVLISKSRLSSIALLAAGAFVSAIAAPSAGCSATDRPDDGAVGARAQIVTDYVTGGDEAYQVEAPRPTARAFGVETYDVAVVDHTIRVTGLAADGASLASIELDPEPGGVHVRVIEGVERHEYVFGVSGSYADRDFTLHLTYDGEHFTAGQDWAGQLVTTGDLAKAPGAATPLIQQMWRDLMPTELHDGVLSAQTVSRCFACFLCGAGLTAFLAALAAIMWVGWPVITAFLSALFTQGTAAAAAVLAAAGVSASVATAVIGAIGAIGWGLVKLCYKCATGDDFVTETAEPIDTEVCPVDVETTPDLAIEWAPVFDVPAPDAPVPSDDTQPTPPQAPTPVRQPASLP